MPTSSRNRNGAKDRDETASDVAEQEAAEIALLKEELRRKEEQHLRTLADFDNYRKRMKRQQEDATRSGMREILLPLLEVLDGFERALEHIGDDPRSVGEGVRAIHRQLLGQLETRGIVQIPSLGEAFDPKVHEAVASVDSGEDEPGAIVDEVRPGYRWGDEILRPARVTVAR